MGKLKSRFYGNLAKIIPTLFLGLLTLLVYNCFLSKPTEETTNTIQDDSNRLNIKNVFYVSKNEDSTTCTIKYKKSILFGFYSYYTEVVFNETYENITNIIKKSDYSDCYYSTSCGGIHLTDYVSVGIDATDCERPCNYKICVEVCTGGGCALMPDDELGGIYGACTSCPECE